MDSLEKLASLDVEIVYPGNDKQKYEEIMHDFLRRDIVKRNNGTLFTTVIP